MRGGVWQEAVNINLGLLSLRSCISALVEGEAHVPYGNSKLTLILSGALGGKCRSLVVVTGSMERRCSIARHRATLSNSTGSMQRGRLRGGERCMVARCGRVSLLLHQGSVGHVMWDSLCKGASHGWISAR